MSILSILLSSQISQGWTTALVGWSIVFAALVLLVIVFTQVPKLIYYKPRKRLRAEGQKEVVTDDDIQVSGEVSAAIAMAIHLYFNELHDEESNVITIKEVRKRYSPWSSKIYGLSEWPKN